jgi:ERCC4-type nuclease
MRMSSNAKNMNEFSNLPALRSLGQLADVTPTIVVDTREQIPLKFERLSSERGGLHTGDYSYKGGENLLSIERKSISDLASCCVGNNRERFERELHRLRGFQFARVLIVGTVERIERGEYRSRIQPMAVLNTLAAFEIRYNIPFIFEATPEAGAIRTENWIYYFAREAVKNVNGIIRAHKPQSLEAV